MRAPYSLALGALVPAISLLLWNEHVRRRHDDELGKLRKDLAALSESRASGDADRGGLLMPVPRGWAPAAAPAAAPAVAARPREEHGDAGTSQDSHERPPVMSEVEIHDNLEMAFIEDHGAAAWGGATKDTAVEKAKAVLPQGSSLRSFECHEAICRIETSHASLMEHSAFARAAFMQPETEIWSAGFYTTRESDASDPNGPMLFVTYLAQPGHNLPFQ